MSSNFTISNVMNFSLVGMNGQTTINCSEGTGLTIIRVSHIYVANLKFRGCGTWRRHTSIALGNIAVHFVLFVENSAEAVFQNLAVNESHGVGLLLLNNHNVVINSSEFSGNNVSSSHWMTSYGGGGGVYIQQSCPSSDHETCYCSNSTHVIEGSTFSNNHANVTYSDLDSIFGVGGGGGIEVFINQSSFNNILICHSTLVRNSARWGGGMQIILFNKSQCNIVSLSNLSVDSNFVTARGGGGIDLLYAGANVSMNNVSLQHVNFSHNRAVFGGGMAVFTLDTRTQQSNQISWDNCIWTENVAHYGAAVNIAPQLILLNNNRELELVMVNCNFTSNSIIDEKVGGYVYRMGKGIILITGGYLAFKEKLWFANNNSTCIYTISSTLLFDEGTNAFFSNNSARIGAGISLIGYSAIVVGNDTSLTFCNNTSVMSGAAIYYFSIDKNSYVYSRSCFIQKLYPQQLDKHVKLNFFGNTALNNPTYLNTSTKDDAIFGTSLKACYSSDKNKFTFEDISTVTYCKTCKGSGENIQECDDSNNNSKPVSTIEGNVSVSIKEACLQFIPGKKFDVPLVHNGGVPPSYRVSIRNLNGSNITIPESFFITGHSLILYGKPGDKATVTLTEVSFRKLTITFEVEAMDCPPLYTIRNSICVCIHNQDVSFVEFHKCLNTDFYASIRLGYWISYENITEGSRAPNRYALLNSYCPLGYCNQSSSQNTSDYLELPSEFSPTKLNDAICMNREGILCGLCVENTSVYFHSEYFRCGNTDLCYLGPLFYLVSEILPLTLLFLLIIFLNISFTSGYLNGFIFFSQIYDTISNTGSSFIAPSYQFNMLSIFHRLFFKLFNMDFFDIDTLSFCLFKTRSTLDILMMKYLTVGYAFFLVLGTVWLIRLCSKFRILKLRKSKYSIIQGLSAFLVMVYSQCTYISLSILNLIYVHKGPKTFKLIVFLQGNIDYMKTEHLPYAIPAVLCLLLFVAPLPLLLIVYPLCNKVLALLKIQENKVVTYASNLIPVTKLKPLLDCFQGTFKDEFRFFAGLYFVYRITILSSRLVSGVILIFTVIEIQLILMLALHTLTWPYQKRIHNIIDLGVFANLAVINALKLLNFFYAENGARSKSVIRVIHAIQLFFVYIPIVVLFAWLLLRILCMIRSCCFRRHRRQDRDKLTARVQQSIVGLESSGDDFLGHNRNSTFDTESYRLIKRQKSEDSF